MTWREPMRAPGGFPVVGVIGGGQLARMMQPPAVALGVQLSVLAEAADASAALVIPSAPVADHGDLPAVLAMARVCDVVTFDHEQVPAHVLAAMVDAGVRLHPKPEALRYAQDKAAMRGRLADLGIGCPRWTIARDADQVAAFGTQVGWPLIAKTPRGGYDGKGVRVVEQAGDLADWLAEVGQEGTLREGILLEEKVDFVRELAVLLARSPSGQAAAWPIVATEQRDGVCAVVCAPASGLDEELAAATVADALRLADALDVTGVLAIEMFEVADADGRSRLLVNELAMRPHNSGHWTIDGATTSQFEQHLRAVLDLPLGDPRPRAPWAVMANVFGTDHDELYPAYRHVMARDPGAKVHLYGKGVRPGRKIGHVTCYGDDLRAVRGRAEHAADYISGVIEE